jgi:hypothetical protein
VFLLPPLVVLVSFHPALDVSAKLSLRGADAEDLWPRVLALDALAEEHFCRALKAPALAADDDQGLPVGLGVIVAERPPPERLRGEPVPSESRLARLAAQRTAQRRRTAAGPGPGPGPGGGQPTGRSLSAAALRRRSTMTAANSAPVAGCEAAAATAAAAEAAEDDDEGLGWAVVAGGELAVLRLTKVAIPAELLEIRDNGPRLKTWQKKK